jgi:hypothetical protein
LDVGALKKWVAKIDKSFFFFAKFIQKVAELDVNALSQFITNIAL